MRDRPGHLFSTFAPLERVAHGGAVTVDGSKWQACVEIDCLVLRKKFQTSDEREQVARRIASINRVVECREQELEALAADIARVQAECETVRGGKRNRMRGEEGVLCCIFFLHLIVCSLLAGLQSVCCCSERRPR